MVLDRVQEVLLQRVPLQRLVGHVQPLLVGAQVVLRGVLYALKMVRAASSTEDAGAGCTVMMRVDTSGSVAIQVV